MGLAPTLQTIQNRPYLPVSCKAGVQSTYSYQQNAPLTCHSRCTAPANDLDSGQHVHRSQAHTELLVEEFELGMLWDEYGLVGDIVVCLVRLLTVAGSLTVTFSAVY
jgi:hypothetical protein